MIRAKLFWQASLHERAIFTSYRCLGRTLAWNFLISKQTLFLFFTFLIANYDPEDDEYASKNGHATYGEALENNNQPITTQPSRLQRNMSMNRWNSFSSSLFLLRTILNQSEIEILLLLCSTKIHENDVKREVQVANVNLAPEIVEVFAHSQIFHDHKPLKTKPKSPNSPPATFTIG